MENTTILLKEQYETFKAENPKVRIRDAAKQLGVSEVELVAVEANNVALRPAFEDILKAIPSLGYVMALTRNDHAVHERKGVYTKAGFNGHVGLVVNPDIDLRFFMDAWQFGFAVEEGERRSLQFFDQAGNALHKIYLTERSDAEAYDRLVSQFQATEQGTQLQTRPVPPAKTETPDEAIDVAAFRQAWLDLKDTHHFFGMLQDFNVSRRQAMRLAPEGHADRISVASLKRILEGVSERGLEIMVFVGNSGCIQIHTGPAKKLLQTGPWFNVLDPEFNLHLREDAIESVWLVCKPTDDGVITSLEAFDDVGRVIVQFFGKRKPGEREREDWRQVVSDYATA